MSARLDFHSVFPSFSAWPFFPRVIFNQKKKIFFHVGWFFFTRSGSAVPVVERGNNRDEKRLLPGHTIQQGRRRNVAGHRARNKRIYRRNPRSFRRRCRDCVGLRGEKIALAEIFLIINRTDVWWCLVMFGDVCVLLGPSNPRFSLEVSSSGMSSSSSRSNFFPPAWKYWLHPLRPASFFRRFSFARRFWNQTYEQKNVSC